MADPTVTANEQADASDAQPSWLTQPAGMPGIALTYLWGLREGTFFFVVPDVAIPPVAMLEPCWAWRNILAAIAGSLAERMLPFSWSSRDPGSALEEVAKVPFVTEQMFAQVHVSYRVLGPGAVFLGPRSGIPYKIYVVAAPECPDKGAFLPVPARAERLLIVWAGFGIAATLLRRSRRCTASQLAIRYGCFWVLFCPFYWGRIAFR